MSSLATDNLYLAAFEITEGAALKGRVVSRANGKTTAAERVSPEEVPSWAIPAAAARRRS